MKNYILTEQNCQSQEKEHLVGVMNPPLEQKKKISKSNEEIWDLQYEVKKKKDYSVRFIGELIFGFKFNQETLLKLYNQIKR